MREDATGSSESAAPALSAELDALLRANARERRLAKGEVLFTYGSAPDALFYLHHGRIRVSTTAASGREAMLGIVEAGQWFGEVSLLMDAPRVYDTRAVVDCELRVVPAATFHALVDEQPKFLREFVRLIGHRYRGALEWIDATVLLPFPTRLARRLLDAQQLHAHAVPSEADAALRLSQEELSQMLGVSRQSVNRQLKQWEGQGILSLDYGCVTLLDKAALRQLAG